MASGIVAMDCAFSKGTISPLGPIEKRRKKKKADGIGTQNNTGARMYALYPSKDAHIMCYDQIRFTNTLPKVDKQSKWSL